MKYNIYDDVLFGHHCNTRNAITGEEEYVLVNENNTDLRVIRSDINFKTCGARDYERIEKDYDYKEELFKYYPKEIGDIKKYEAKVKKLDPEERECFDFNYDSYRGANTTGIASNVTETKTGITIYPTLISSLNPKLTINNTNESALNIQVIDVTGKLIYKNTNVVNGITTISLSTSEIAEGVYLVKYQDANGSVSGTQKIIVTK